MRKGTLKKALALALTGAVLVGAFAGCGAKKDSGDKKETKKIVIGGVAELTAPCADISPNHEGCGAFPPTFPHIGATAAATDGM